MTDLHSVALAALRINGFAPDIDDSSRRELATLRPAPMPSGLRDLRALLWSSIDNTESKDLDQIEYAEELPDKSTRLLVAIADVDALVHRGSALDQHASANATSVYTGIAVFPMLPNELSTGLTSLNQGEDRIVIVIELVLDPDGTPRSHDVYRAIATNRAKLAYDGVGSWLEGHGPLPAAGRTDARARAATLAAGSHREPGEDAPAASGSARVRNCGGDGGRAEWGGAIPRRDAKEPRARPDRGFHDRRQRRDRAVSRGKAAVSDQACGARTEALEPHCGHRGQVLVSPFPHSRSRRRSRIFLPFAGTRIRCGSRTSRSAS